MDDARREGGQVLVHCRVGVSRSATVVVSSCPRLYLALSFDGLPCLDCLRDEGSQSPSRRRISHRSLASSLGTHTAQHEAAVQSLWVGGQTWSREGRRKDRGATQAILRTALAKRMGG